MFAPLAVMVAVPRPTAFTMPNADTVATALSDVAQVRVGVVVALPVESTAVTVSDVSSPGCSWTFGGKTTMATTADDGVVDGGVRISAGEFASEQPTES